MSTPVIDLSLGNKSVGRTDLVFDVFHRTPGCAELWLVFGSTASWRTTLGSWWKVSTYTISSSWRSSPTPAPSLFTWCLAGVS